MTANGCGTHGRWKTGCPDCQRISRAYERKRRAARQNGTWKPLVPQPQVLAHLEALYADGATPTSVANASGLPLRTVLGIRHRKVVQGETAAAIFSVKEAVAKLPAGMTSAFGAARRLQALTALGWSLTEQARRAGMHLQQLAPIASGKQATISVRTDETVRTVFEQLCATPGGSVRARNDAARKGWLPPLAWDDIDNPQEIPATDADEDGGIDEVAVERALSGDRVALTDAEIVAVLQAGVARGDQLSKLSARLGLNYFGARKLLGGELTPHREKQQRIEAELRRSPNKPDSTIAALLGVHHQTVTRARVRLAKKSKQLAS